MKDFTIKKKDNHTTSITMHGEVPVIRYDALSELPDITHGFSTRIGGFSQGPYASMDLSFTRGDDPDTVMKNFCLFGNAIGVQPEEMIFVATGHTTNVREVQDDDFGKGILKDFDYVNIDGLVTNKKHACLVAFYADCVPLFFVDPVKKAIGLSHSGWRGTVGKMAKVTIEKMTALYGCDPKDIIAAVGPSICQDCYEVSEDVANQFKLAFTKSQITDILLDKGNGKYQLDLWAANHEILLEAGVTEDHISLPDICTCCNYEVMWSHRKLGLPRGGLAAFLMLK